MKLIIDTDPGIDDAMAYFYAHAAKAFDIVGLTTVFGNVTVDDATRNALWMVQASGTSTYVYRGHSVPLEITPNEPSAHVHGARGFGDYEIDEPKSKASDMPAADYLVQAARAAPGELTVCAVGPLTNIALAVQKDPEFVSNLRQLVIMGGALDAPGNVTPYAEANFWNDPHAADIVVNAPGGGAIIIVGLDVTDKIAFTPQDFRDVAKASPLIGGFLNEIGKFYMDFYQQRFGEYFCSLHDPAAVIACHKPDLFEMEEVALSVGTKGENIGNMVRRTDGAGRKCFVCLRAKSDDVVCQYKQTVSINP